LLLLGLSATLVACGMTKSMMSAPIHPQESYLTMAAQILPPQWAIMMEGVGNVTINLRPGADAHAYRDWFFAARNFLDVFIYAYPVVKVKSSPTMHSSKNDLAQVIRDDLADGFVLIGDFNDLQFVNYTEKDRLDRLLPLLQWKASFLANDQKYQYTAFIGNVSTTSLTMRKKSDLSYEFWGSTKAEPSLSLTGIQNLALLVSGQVLSEIQRYPTVFNLTDIWKESNIGVMHDYRKLSRAGFYVYNFEFPSVIAKNCTFEQGVVMGTYTLLGNVHDMVNQYYYYLAHNNATMAEQCKEKSTQLWTGVQGYVLHYQLYARCLPTINQSLISF